MRVQFIESPTGAHNLAYDAGMIADLPDALAAKLIEQGFAVEVKPEKRITKSKAAEKRAQVPGNDGASKRTSKPKRS